MSPARLDRAGMSANFSRKGKPKPRAARENAPALPGSFKSGSTAVVKELLKRFLDWRFEVNVLRLLPGYASVGS